jgi:hypothetical protein
VHSRYVYFAAADDWVLPGFFAKAIEVLETHANVGLYCGEALLVNGLTGRPFGYRPPVRPTYRAGAVGAAHARRLLRRSDNWILTGSAVFRRSAVLWTGAFDPRLGSFADGYLARKVALTFGFWFVPEAVAAWCVYPDSVSRQTARKVASAQRLLDVAPARLAIDPVFPRWYAERFERRWRFAVCRLALMGDPVDWPLVTTLGARRWIDRFVIRAASQSTAKPLTQVLALGWLWLRLRPYALRGLVRTALARRKERRAGSRLDNRSTMEAP